MMHHHIAGDLDIRIAEDASELGNVLEQWDDLAVATAAPYAAPGWCMSWWDHVAPPSAELRVIQVFRGSTLVAVAPMYLLRQRLGVVRYGFLGGGTSSRVAPVALPSASDDAAESIAVALATSRPRPDVVEFNPTLADESWATRLQRHWPGNGATTVRTQSMAAPGTALDTGDEPWLQTKSRNFRQQARRRRRQLIERGMAFRLARTPEAIIERMQAFERLHESRFRYRGGSSVLDADVMHMLKAAATRLSAGDRFRLWTIENDDHVISAHVFLAAGGEVTYWLGGFDDGWGAQQPALQTLVAAIQHASESGDSRLDLGPGAQEYKSRLSDHTERLEWVMLFPPGSRRYLAYSTVLAQPLVSSLRLRLLDAIPAEKKNRIKRRLRRPGAEN